jgi:hypothetical protein
LALGILGSVERFVALLLRQLVGETAVRFVHHKQEL